MRAWLALMVLSMGLGLLLLACGAGGSCRSTDDCFGELECSGPDDGPVCGMPPRQLCATDQDCVESVCHAAFDACSVSGLGSECGPPCTDDAPCGPGLRCGAGGACEPVPCDEGFTCARHEACDPGSIADDAPVWARHHGCVRVDCASDDDCAAGLACVNGFCQSGAGSCVVPMAVP
jgi:hypothetical protein